MDFEVTKREVMVSVIIFFVLFSIGLLISNAISEHKMLEIEKYNKALKINNDANMFKYAIDTEVGNILTYGRFNLDKGVSFDELKDEYMAIEKETEEYRRHHRVVCSGSGKTRHCHTEVYYSWDTIKVDKKAVDSVNFLKQKFDYNLFCGYPVYTLDIASNIVDSKKANVSGSYYYKNKSSKFWHSVGDIRYVYYYTPKVFNGTIFAKATKKTIKNVDGKGCINIETTDLETTYKSKRDGKNIANIIFWFIWIIVIGLAIYGYVYMDNDYLED